MSNFSFPIKLTINKNIKIIFFYCLLGFLILNFITLSILCFYYKDKIYPNIQVDLINVGNQTKEQALIKLISQDQRPTNHQVTITADEIQVSSSSAQLNAYQDIEEAISQAFEHGHNLNFAEKCLKILSLLIKPLNISSKTRYGTNQVEFLVQAVKNQFDVEGRDPSAQLKISGTISSLMIDPGETGRSLLLEETVTKVMNNLNDSDSKIEALTEITNLKLNNDEVAKARQRAEIFIDKQATFNKDYSYFYLNDQDLISLLTFPTGISQKKIDQLLTKWDDKFLKQPQNAEFEYDENTLQVTKFVPQRDGAILDRDNTKQQITDIISSIEENPDANTSFNLELKTANLPAATTLSDLNDLGINEIIGFGDSYYQHSIASRIYNVALTAKNINYYIVKPGEEFSFNKAIGDVSKTTGYQQAYIIKDGQTILGDGGGVCQVSTTLFRALLDAGLNVTRRVPHSYRVSYYELNKQPGFDATVYSGNTDLRFINDTGRHVLIYTEADSNNLYLKVELYGTADGRTTEIKNYKTWGYTPPLASVYYPDASLPTGKLKQIDWASSGIKASFTNVIKDKDGNLIREDKYYSNYQAWSAKYLQGI